MIVGIEKGVANSAFEPLRTVIFKKSDLILGFNFDLEIFLDSNIVIFKHMYDQISIGIEKDVAISTFKPLRIVIFIKSDLIFGFNFNLEIFLRFIFGFEFSFYFMFANDSEASWVFKNFQLEIWTFLNKHNYGCVSSGRT